MTRALVPVLALLSMLVARPAAADCNIDPRNPRQCTDCSCLIDKSLLSRPRALVNEDGRILFGDWPAQVTALNTTFTVQRGGATPCGPSKLLYAGQVYLQSPGHTDGNCWRMPANAAWTAIGPCAVCY